MQNSEEKVKVVTTKVACQILQCSRTYFYEKYMKRLTVYKSENGYHNLYLLNEVNDIADSLKKKNSNVLTNYEIVSKP